MKLVDLPSKYRQERAESMHTVLMKVGKDVDAGLLKGMFITGLDDEGKPFYYFDYEEGDEVEMVGAIMCTMSNILKNRGNIL